MAVLRFTIVSFISHTYHFRAERLAIVQRGPSLPLERRNLAPETAIVGNIDALALVGANTEDYAFES